MLSGRNNRNIPSDLKGYDSANQRRTTNDGIACNSLRKVCCTRGIDWRPLEVEPGLWHEHGRIDDEVVEVARIACIPRWCC